MTLKEHYRCSTRKSLKPFFKLIVLFFIVIAVSQTFARYTSTAANNGAIGIAKWHVEINGQLITATTTGLSANVNLLNATGDTTSIDSKDICYFDLIINPSTTEVSVSYSISVDLTQSTLPTGTKILKYQKYINTGANETMSGETNINSNTMSVSENIKLLGASTAHGNSSIRRYRIFCEVPFPIDVTQNDMYTINPVVIVEQYIGE